MMMSSEKEGGSMGKKTSSSKPQQAAASQINCPRCDSPNTKFCYYNNYSLSQPRHFCKTCRRYWTNGGSLRNVPIGGGCRKNKKMMKPSSSSVVSCDHRSSDSAAPCDRIGGLNVPSRCLTSHGFSAWWPVNNFPRLQSSDTDDTRLTDPNHFSNTRSPPISSNFSLDPPGSSNFPLSFASGIFREMGSSSFNSSPSLASSIESLSTINQDLHWKLQQQRLAMLCVGDYEKENDASITTHKLSGTVEIETHHVQKPQPILFQNLETDDDQSYCGIQDVSRKESGVGGTLATEWFFDNYSLASVNPTPETSSGNMISNENPSNWNGGIQAWSDLAHFTALP